MFASIHQKIDGPRRRGLRLRLTASLVAAMLIAAACTGGQDGADGGDGSGQGQDRTADGSDDGASGSSDDTEARPRASVDVNVPTLPGGRIVAPDPDGPSVDLVTLREDPYIGAAVYPRPDYEANPWSQWGQGKVVAGGRVISSIGDHLGVDGNSYLFVYEPDARTLTRFADVLSALPHEEGSWGYGKVHGQMVDPGDGSLFFTTYYGSRRDISFDGSYEGDVLFRLDTETLDLQPVAVPLPGFGIPSLASDGAGLLYGEAVDPLLGEGVYPAGGFLVYDTTIGEVRRFEERPDHEVFRNVMVGLDGTAWYAGQAGSLYRYDPDADTIEDADQALTADLRATTVAASDGTIYGVTDEPYDFFAFEPGGEVRSLGQAPWYSTSLALLPDESGFLYVPGAHGETHLLGAPLIAVDTDTGDQTTIVELLDLVRDEFGLVLGGTYSITVDEERGQAHIGFNAGETADSPWGEVVFVVVDLPAAAADGSGAENAAPSGGSGRLVDSTAELGIDEALAGIRGHAVATADVNDDGWPDLFVGTFADRPVDTYDNPGGPAPDRLLLGSAAGFTIDPAFEGRLGRTAGAVFDDLDDDGDPDLIVSRNVRDGERADAPSEIYRNDDGRLVPSSVLDDHRGGRAVATVDFDGDGRRDIILVEDRWSGSSTALFANEGGLRFSDVTSELGFPTDVFGLGVAVGDLNGDGEQDLVVGGSNRWFLGNGEGFEEGAGSPLPWKLHGDEDDPAHVVVDDVDGDGLLDVLVGQHFNSTIDDDIDEPVRLFLNTGIDDDDQPAFVDATDRVGLPSLATKSPQVLLVDLDGDGREQLVLTASTDAGGGEFSPVVLRDGSSSRGTVAFGPSTIDVGPHYWIDAVALDVNGDRRQDLFFVEWEPTVGSRLFLNLPAEEVRR